MQSYFGFADTSENSGCKDLVEAQLAASVQESLTLKLVDNARFLCERLVAANRAEVRLMHHKVHCFRA